MFSNLKLEKERSVLVTVPKVNKKKVLGEKEKDMKKVKRRMRQILLGRNSLSYLLYKKKEKEWEREEGKKVGVWKERVEEPNPFQTQSTKVWLKKTSNWRRDLHKFDGKEIELKQIFERQSSLFEKVDKEIQEWLYQQKLTLPNLPTQSLYKELEREIIKWNQSKLFVK